jgi:chemotaxis protein CheD
MEDSRPVNGADTHFLFPSELMVKVEPFQIQTLLGSCIAVCLFDQRRKMGGMNHFMVPLWNGEGLASPKYGNIAIEALVDKMEAFRSEKKDWVAKIFGGASQFENSIINVGERNIQVTESMLESLRIPVIASSVGGEQGRKIWFDTFTGQVKMKYIVKQGH